jgi:cobalt-zinc-cadmium efflux system membrane fusion protein
MIKYNRFLLLSAFFIVFFVGRIGNAEESIIELTPLQIENLGIKLGKLEPASQIPLFSAPAKVSVPPSHEYVVSSSQAGLIVKMNASLGDKVAKGDLLAVIKSPDFLTLQSNYLKAVGALKLATATYNRDKKLLKEGVVSGRNEQESYSGYKTAWVEANEAKQLLGFAGMDEAEFKKLDSTGQLASQVNIRSPIAGRILERLAVTGGRVDNQTPLYRIANLDELWLEINSPQEQIGDLKIGDNVLVENTTAVAEIKVLGQSVNPENQTMMARAIVKNYPLTLRVGQKVMVQHLQTTDAETYKLPDTAIAHNHGKTYDFIKENNGFKVSEVTILGKQADGSVVTGGFSGNEEIALNNVVTLKAKWLGLGAEE